MRLQAFKRLIKEDYKEEQREMIEKLGFSLNTFADDITNLLNKNITIEDNLNQAKKTVKTSVDASGTPISPLAFKTGLTDQCYGIQCVRAINTTTSTSYPTSTPLLSFTESNNVLTINNITGLVAGSTYSLNLILFS